ncbi:MAG: DUF1573 domain-containing protein [Spirochaetaceae bacterium]|nr:MAG: DUF1573 domain-containing protein [Spirochaetaceae bacterium]
MKKVVAAVIGAVIVLAVVSCDLFDNPKPQIMVLTTEGNDTVFKDFGHDQLIEFETQTNVAIDKTFKIRNAGNAPLTIDSITTEASQTAFTIFGGSIPTTVLQPDEEMSFKVQILSDHVANHDSKLLIPNDDPEESNFYLRLAATVMPN